MTCPRPITPGHPQNGYPPQEKAGTPRLIGRDTHPRKGTGLKARWYLVLAQEAGDDLTQRFRVAPVSFGPRDATIGWAVIDMAGYDGGLDGCLFTASQENAERLRDAAERYGELVPTP